VPGASSFTSISWFTNDFDTRTRGVDVVVNYTARSARAARPDRRLQLQ
jgi:iron complex outermembrane receptor protein